MRKRRLYIAPQTKYVNCLYPLMLMTSPVPSKIYYSKTGPKPYDPDAEAEQDNIANWGDGDDIDFEFEE